MDIKKNLHLSLRALPAVILVLGIAIIAAGCNSQTKKKDEKAAPPIEVSVQSAISSRTLRQDIEYPATVSAEQEAKIVAKTSGTAEDISFKVGDKVNLGAVLVKIDDVNSTRTSGAGFDANQIKQAQVAAEQAQTNYEMARTSYLNLIQSAGKDLKQIEIARSQAETGQQNLETTTGEALKSAQLAYDTAKIAVEQARLAYENRKTTANQSEGDTGTNSVITANSAVDSCNTMIVSLNTLAELDNENGGNLPYHMNLGAMNQQSMTTAKQAYKTAKAAVDTYRATNFSNLDERVAAALDVANKTKALTDAMKNVVDNTVSSNYLPQSSATGVSISGMQSTVAGFQTQINGLVAQLNGVKQGVTNLKLNNDTSLDALQKAYELSQQQEKVAAQNLESLKAGNKTQKDQAAFGVEAATNQYSATKTKLDTQISVSKSQADLAELQYRNAVIALQNLIDIHQTISPIEGIVTKKSVENGDTVSAGQILAVVSTPERLKIQFFVGEDELSALVSGMDVSIKDSDGNIYPANISAITPQADPVTRRYLVEVRPKEAITEGKLPLGSVTTIVVPITKTARDGAYLLPLAAVEVAQSGTSIFTVDNGNKIQKVLVKVEKVEGENAEVSAALADDARIVVDGNKLVKEGETVTVK